MFEKSLQSWFGGSGLKHYPPQKTPESFAKEVEQITQDVVRLSAKAQITHIELPEDIPDLPTELSYWVAKSLRVAWRVKTNVAENGRILPSTRTRSRNFTSTAT